MTLYVGMQMRMLAIMVMCTSMHVQYTDTQMRMHDDLLMRMLLVVLVNACVCRQAIDCVHMDMHVCRCIHMMHMCMRVREDECTHTCTQQACRHK